MTEPTRPRILIGIFTGQQYPDRRRRCRGTWMADVRRHDHLDVVFLVGAAGVACPVRIDDAAVLPCPNDYGALPQRTRWFARWALETQAFDYLFKCDDDTYVAVDRLAEYDLAGRDYVGAEWTPGIGYGSGGAGYFLSRKAAGIVARRLVQTHGAEDLLVGQVLREAGVPLAVDPRFVPYANETLRPRADNTLVTGHAFSPSLFLQSHREVGGEPWKFRIVMPTSNGCIRAAETTLVLLDCYWPDHPPVDLLHYEEAPGDRPRVTKHPLGRQAEKSWSQGMAEYLERSNTDDLLLLMLDDYGLCQPVDRARLKTAHEALLADPAIANIHLTWQPCPGKTPHGPVLRLPPWGYSVNTQAALWRRSALLRVLQANPAAGIDQFELQGSRWFNAQRSHLDLHCQAAIPDPPVPSSFVDRTDKRDWVVAYHNLVHRGKPDAAYQQFLAEHGLSM